MKRHPPGFSRPPANDNRADRAANDNRVIPSEEPSLADLSHVLRDSIFDFIDKVAEALSPAPTDNENVPPRFDELLQAELTSSLRRCIAEWNTRLEPAIAAAMADRLIYNAATIMGRRIWHHETHDSLFSEMSDDAPGDVECAGAFLQRLNRFAELFGESDSWNGVAARRYALDRLARPLGLIAGQDDAAALAVADAVDVIDVVKRLLAELAARSWRDMVGVFLELPANIPSPPGGLQRWQDGVDLERLARALDRSVACDGLVRILPGYLGEAHTGVVSEHSIWLLMTADDDDHDDNHAEDEPGRSERRLGGIGWVDVEAVAAALSGPESNPVGEWRTEELTISRPRLVIQLADGIVDPGARIREIARVPGPGRAVGDGPDALLVIAEFSDGWSVWSIPIALAERSARASVLRLDRDPAALPAGVRVHHFDSRPRPVRGACSRPLVALHGDGLGMHRLRYNDDEQRDEGYPAQGCTERVFIEGVEPLEVDGVHGLNSDADEAESHVLLTCGDELHLYRSSQPDQPWWRASELVCDAHATLAAGVSLFGVARDLLIFQLPDGLWAFLPMLALCPTESPWLAEIAAAANGLVLHADEPAPAQLTPLPLWVRVGQLADLSVGPDGSFAVTFQDSSWAELYVRSKGNLPAYACAVDGRYDGRGSGVCHVGLGDDRYLLLRTHHERVEFSWLSFDSTDWQVARILG